jgi:hypothetical protein
MTRDRLKTSARKPKAAAFSTRRCENNFFVQACTLSVLPVPVVESVSLFDEVVAALEL